MSGTLPKYIDKQPLGAYGNFSPRCNENPKFDPAGIRYEFDAAKPAFLLKQDSVDYDYVKE